MTGLIRLARATDATAVGDILFDFLSNTPWMPKLHNQRQTQDFCAMMIERSWISVAEVSGQVVAFLARYGPFLPALYVARGMCGQHLGHGRVGGL